MAITKRCTVCKYNVGATGENFMIHNNLWLEVCNNFTNYYMGRRDDLPRVPVYLCIGCLEFHLGRQLNCFDFTLCPMNYLPQYYRSKRLIERMFTSPDGQDLSLSRN